VSVPNAARLHAISLPRRRSSTVSFVTEANTVPASAPLADPVPIRHHSACGDISKACGALKLDFRSHHPQVASSSVSTGKRSSSRQIPKKKNTHTSPAS
jgi:hypothetical protein